jgi:hypothetical protein
VSSRGYESRLETVDFNLLCMLAAWVLGVWSWTEMYWENEIGRIGN